MARERKRWRQETIEFRKTGSKRGGRRKGAGRKRGEKSKVRHRTRARLDGQTPVHLSFALLPEVGRLRRRDTFRAIRHALARTAHRDHCRIVQFSIQANHLHLVAEPTSKDGLARAMISFKTSCARRLNALLGRRGRVFADRYHAVHLATPTQVRNALSYVLNNWRHHGHALASSQVDEYSSADFFDGWANRAPRRPWWLAPDDTPPVAQPRLWLLTKGWRARGLIGTWEVPGT